MKISFLERNKRVFDQKEAKQQRQKQYNANKQWQWKKVEPKVSYNKKNDHRDDVKKPKGVKLATFQIDTQ